MGKLYDLYTMYMKILPTKNVGVKYRNECNAVH